MNCENANLTSKCTESRI